MMKNIAAQQQQLHVEEENMSNLTSAAASGGGGGEASAASSNNGGNNNSNMYIAVSHQLSPQSQQQQQQQQINKKKRNQPGHPDPDAEVISLSPRSLLATNRFVCEVCNKGFQRDQNLQLHRRGHSLPWKLKQRNNKEVIRKKVYVCPETSCVHHDPSRALGDLTGIKKHFRRKHGEKKWKCDKCSKKYAVQSDWKAHSKICGTKEYRCDCGTLFSRRDSFITHRAFCDALAEESARNTTATTTTNIISNNNPLQGSSSTTTRRMLPHNHINLQQHLHSQQFPLFQIKKEHEQQQSFNLRPPEMPPWLSCPLPVMDPPQIDLTTSSSSSSMFHDFQQNQDHLHHRHPNPNPNGTHMGPSFDYPASPHISATALLQKAAQMGSKTSTPNSSSPPPPGTLFMNMMIRPTVPHVSAPADSCLNLSSRDHQLINDWSSYGNKAAAATVAGTTTSNNDNNTSSLLHEMMMMNNPHPLSNPSFDQGFGSFHATSPGKNSGNHSDKDGMTRDFLGLRPLSQSDIMMSIAGLSNCMNSSDTSTVAAACSEQNQKSWQGN